jgi:hypothetical protein
VSNFGAQYILPHLLNSQRDLLKLIYEDANAVPPPRGGPWNIDGATVKSTAASHHMRLESGSGMLQKPGTKPKPYPRRLNLATMLAVLGKNGEGLTVPYLERDGWVWCLRGKIQSNSILRIKIATYIANKLAPGEFCSL